MGFIQKTLTIKDITTKTRQVEAWTGDGTGLAYVQTLDRDGHLMPDTYNLLHIKSGYALPFKLETPEEAQTFLEKVAAIFEDKWDCSLREIKKRVRRDQSHIMAQVELAHYDSVGPYVDFFLYAATEDDVCGESCDAANQDPQSPENEKIAQELLGDHPEATKAVMASVADADGIHNVLRTFERQEAPMYKTFKDAQAALDHGETIRIEVEPFVPPLDLLRLARQFQDKESLGIWKQNEH